MKKTLLLIAVVVSVGVSVPAVALLSAGAAEVDSVTAVKKKETKKEIARKLYGRIQIVDAFPDYRVEVVNAFPDLRVEIVDAFPNSPGRWQLVDAFPDYRVEIVDAFGDVSVQFVDAFPGVAK